MAPWWSGRAGIREGLSSDVIAAIDRIGSSLPHDADVEVTLALLHSQGLAIIGCLAGLMVLRNMSLREARVLVETSSLFLPAKDVESATALAVQQPSTATDPSERSPDGSSGKA
jgi:hypothetical protein